MDARWLALLGLLILGLLPPPGAHAQDDARCFPETGFCISGPIRAYWERNGGLPVFGYPISPVQLEQIERWAGPAQWFERDRLEDHTAQGEGVLAGRLGAELLARQGRPWQLGGGPPPARSAGPCRYFPQTGHSICNPPFRAYWEQHGGLERFGYPITSAFPETIDGQTYIVQYFERRRMEYHPENRPPYDVLLGLLGRDMITSPPLPLPTCSEPVLPELQANVAAFDRETPLGCPVRGAGFSAIAGAAARFERGHMYWVKTPRGAVIYAVAYEPAGRVTYRVFEDTWHEGEPINAGLLPPPGLHEPNRGFGKVWRENPDVQRLLGWAQEQERAVQPSFQVFQNGFVLRIAEDGVVWRFTAPDSAQSAALQY